MDGRGFSEPNACAKTQLQRAMRVAGRSAVPAPDARRAQQWCQLNDLYATETVLAAKVHHHGSLPPCIAAVLKRLVS
jgi:hypothetical protein